jgi:hypothetical protein
MSINQVGCELGIGALDVAANTICSEEVILPGICYIPCLFCARFVLIIDYDCYILSD